LLIISHQATAFSFGFAIAEYFPLTALEN